MIPMRVVDGYRRDMRAARLRLAALERSVVETRFGRVEYIDRGEGPVVLVIHGITQGADGGLRELADDLVPEGYSRAPTSGGRPGPLIERVARPTAAGTNRRALFHPRPAA